MEVISEQNLNQRAMVNSDQELCRGDYLCLEKTGLVRPSVTTVGPQRMV